MYKNCFVGGMLSGRIGIFILYEHNEEVVMDIFKMEDLFGMGFFPDLFA